MFNPYPSARQRQPEADYRLVAALLSTEVTKLIEGFIDHPELHFAYTSTARRELREAGYLLFRTLLNARVRHRAPGAVRAIPAEHTAFRLFSGRLTPGIRLLDAPCRCLLESWPAHRRTRRRAVRAKN